MDIQTLKEEISTLHDARRTAYGHIRHRLEDIVIIGLCVAICGGEDFADMETFGREREAWLRKFLGLPNGIPDADTFRRVAVPRRTTLDKGHGRVEEREYALLTDVGWLAQRPRWKASSTGVSTWSSARTPRAPGRTAPR